MEKVIEGGCLCGAIRYRIDKAPERVGVCYCRQCQRAGASEGSHAVGIEVDDFTLLEGSPKFFVAEADSGHEVRRGFCEECGSHLMAYPVGYPGFMSVRVASLDDPAPFAPQVAFYIESAQPWTRLPEGVPHFSGAFEASPKDEPPESESIGLT